MNLLEHWVYNITSDTLYEGHPGWHIIVCDVSCWGQKEIQVELHLTPKEYEFVKKNGYYLA